jgi:tetratricopeptide (TPR) repeat protein
MSETSSLYDRYLELIDQIVQTTLKGKIRSKEQVFQMLVEGIQTGTGELFERGLQDSISTAQRRADTETDEFRQAKAARSLRALQTIQGEWQRWQLQNQGEVAIATAIQHITSAPISDRLTVFVGTIDPNRSQCLSAAQLKQLANALQQEALGMSDPTSQQDMQQLSQGILQGLQACNQVQAHLVSWVYENEQEIGFGSKPNQADPWVVWAKYVTNPLPKGLFQTVSAGQSVMEFVARLPKLEVASWVELVILLQYLQQGVVAWADQLAYSAKISRRLSVSSFLMFAIIWSQIARGLEMAAGIEPGQRDRWANAAFQVSIQILRVFSQRQYFPLYGNSFGAFPGSRLRNIVDYLDEPLKRTEGHQEKARILTLIGSSERSHGQLERAKDLHTIARDLATEAGDRPCEIANLNHLSRTCAAQKDYGEALRYSQQALILSRQVGDQQGQANALVNLGYSEVLQAHQREQADPTTYETAISYLQQGLKLAEQLGDSQSLAFGYNSLGIAYLMLEQPSAAISHLVQGLNAAQIAGDLYLQGLDLTYLAEAYYQEQNLNQAIYAGCLAMYYLDSIASREWRQSAGLLTVIQGQMGDDFQKLLEEIRPNLIRAIGVEGYEHIPNLIQQYRSLTG